MTANIRFHILRFINNHNRIDVLNITNGRIATFILCINHIVFLGKGINIHHQNLNMIAGSKGF